MPGIEVFPTAMVTGHRPKNLTGAEIAWAQVALHHTAWRLRSKYGTTVGVSGMALGADTWWALAVLASGMHLHAHIPFLDQPKPWPEGDQVMWTELRRKATREVVVGGQGYDVKMLHARNESMLAETAEASGLVVAVYKPGTGGGTASAISKAEQRGLPMLLLDPTTRRIERKGW